jgi:hypothetical protein
MSDMSTLHLIAWMRTGSCQLDHGLRPEDAIAMQYSALFHRLI